MARLGSMVGRSRSAVRMWERGESTPNDPAVVVALAAVLGVEEDRLFDSAGVPRPSRDRQPTVEEALATLKLPAEGAEGRRDVGVAPPTEGEPPGRELPREPVDAPPPVASTPPAPRVPTSYLEDRGERTRYQLRVLATVVAVTALILVLVWAFGEFREAIASVWDSLRGEPPL